MGALIVSGNLVFQSAASYLVQVSPTSASNTFVTGSTTVDGTLTANAVGGPFTTNQVFPVLSSTGPLTGTFTLNTTGSFGAAVLSLQYSPHEVFLVINAGGAAPPAWSAIPATSDWNTAANWTTSTVPTATDIAQFNTSTTTTIDIRQANTQVGGLQFNTGAPAYIFNVTGTAGVASSLIVSGSGVADISGNAPTFVVSGVAGALGTLQFTNSATPDDAVDPHPGVRPDDFHREQHGSLARFITDAGGLVDFSGTSGPSGNNRITAGSIEGAGTYNLGGNTLIVGLNGLSTTVSGTINDGGASGGIGASLVKLGAGTLVLSGDNTYTGLTAILAGTLQLGDGGTSGSILGNVFDHTTLAVNRSDTYTHAGRIIGDGAVVQAGPGTTILTGNNLYLGGTTISAGTLQLGNGGTSGSIVGDVVDNGIFAINRSDTYSFGGAISGSGAVVQIGPGTTILTGTNSYSGGTAINAGVLAVSADANLGAAAGGLAFNGGTLQFLSGFTTSRAVTLNAGGGAFDTNGNSATLAGAIGGSGGLSKIGAGTLTLTGASSYRGATAVNAGALVVNGSIANSAVTVNAGAVLSGVGTVGATTINSGGTFAPGNSPGTMTVAGNLAFQSGALYLVQINPSTASSANAITGGSAALAGTVNAAFASGSYVSRTYTILSAAGGLNGTVFGNLTTSNLPTGFTANLNYTGNDVILNLIATLGSGSGGSGGLGTGGLSGNQRNVANALNDFFNIGGALPPAFVAIFGLTGSNLGNALSQLSGEPATGSQQVGFQMTSQFLSLMLDPFVDGRSGIADSNGPALWFAPEREALPEEHRACVFLGAQGAAEGVALRSGLERMGLGLRRQQPHGRRPGRAGKSRPVRQHGGICRRPRQSHLTGHGGGHGARRRRHELEPGNGTGWRQERCFPGRPLRRNALGSRLSQRRARLHQSLDVDRSFRLCGRPSHRELQRPEPGRAGGERVPNSHRCSAALRLTSRSRLNTSARRPTARPISTAVDSRSPTTHATQPTPAASSALASTGRWFSISAPCSRCTRASRGRTTG